MDKKALGLKLIEDVATRQNLPPAVIAAVAALDLSAYGSPVRIGEVLQSLQESGSTAPRHLADERALAVGPYLFYPAESYLESGAGELRLTEKERDILLALIDADGGVVHRDVLLDQVWGYASGVETHTLETHIYRLRQKIETDPANPAILITSEDGYSLGA